jgi:hypothetical protein
MSQLHLYSEGGCAASAVDSSGAVRGFTMPRRELPFVPPAIQHDPKTQRGNGRVVQMTVKRPNGSPVALSCWMPNTMTSVDLVKSIGASKTAWWSSTFSELRHARAIPDSAHRQSLSDEAKAFEAEMLAPASNQTVATASPHAASLNVGCDDVSGTFTWWDGYEWVEISVEVNVCSDTYGDFFGWLIDNGYGSVSRVVVESNNYEVEELDSVTFTATIVGTGTVPRIGWSWEASGGTAADPWTTACTGHADTCKIQVHGTGTMHYTVAVVSGDVSGGMSVRADQPPDVGELGDDDGDASGAGTPSTNPAINGVSELTGQLILIYAFQQPDWVYTQGCDKCDPAKPDWTEPAKDLPNHYGDCGDFVWWVMNHLLGSTAWPYAVARTVTFGNFTATTAPKYGYLLTDSAHVRAGDVVVRDEVSGGVVGGGHVGVFWHWGAGGHPIGWANNGKPASSKHPNSDGLTGRFDFKQTSGWITRYFRPATP